MKESCTTPLLVGSTRAKREIRQSIAQAIEIIASGVGFEVAICHLKTFLSELQNRKVRNLRGTQTSKNKTPA